jgi:hypothetical protein
MWSFCSSSAKVVLETMEATRSSSLVDLAPRIFWVASFHGMASFQ